MWLWTTVVKNTYCAAFSAGNDFECSSRRNRTGSRILSKKRKQRVPRSISFPIKYSRLFKMNQWVLYSVQEKVLLHTQYSKWKKKETPKSFVSKNHLVKAESPWITSGAYLQLRRYKSGLGQCAISNVKTWLGNLVFTLSNQKETRFSHKHLNKEMRPSKSSNWKTYGPFVFCQPNLSP